MALLGDAVAHAVLPGLVIVRWSVAQLAQSASSSR
jgi:ABC-type Mn2+/Zn2+ transport system permease subunit